MGEREREIYIYICIHYSDPNITEQKRLHSLRDSACVAGRRFWASSGGISEQNMTFASSVDRGAAYVN